MEVKNSQPDQKEEEKDQKQSKVKVQVVKSIRICSSCPHKHATHYAKNMCKNCYHRRGREKKADKCPHTDKAHYSKGLCQNCYLADNYLKRKAKGKVPAKKAGKAKQSDAEDDEESRRS